MKANHNTTATNTLTAAVVANINKSKNESKSQPKLKEFKRSDSCSKYQ